MNYKKSGEKSHCECLSHCQAGDSKARSPEGSSSENRLELIRKVVALSLSSRNLENGKSWFFSFDQNTANLIEQLIAAEKHCCAHLTWMMETNENGQMVLTVTGIDADSDLISQMDAEVPSKNRGKHSALVKGGAGLAGLMVACCTLPIIFSAAGGVAILSSSIFVENALSFFAGVLVTLGLGFGVFMLRKFTSKGLCCA